MLPDRSMRLTDEALRGKTAIGADGHAIGEVSGLFLDRETWTVEALELKLRPEIADRIGAHRTVFRAGKLEIPVSLVQSVGDAVVLNIDVEGLGRFPEIDEPALH